MSAGIFEIERLGKTVVLNLRRGLDEIEFDRPPRDAQEVLDLLQGRHIENIIVDCHDIDFLRSTALGFFVALSKKATKRGGQMIFCNVSSRAKKILHATKLDQIWMICGSRSESIEAVEKRSTQSEGDVM